MTLLDQIIDSQHSSNVTVFLVKKANVKKTLMGKLEKFLVPSSCGIISMIHGIVWEYLMGSRGTVEKDGDIAGQLQQQK